VADAINTHPPHQGKGEGEKRRETYKLEMKTALLIINKPKYRKSILSFPGVGCHGGWCPSSGCQAGTRKSQTGLGFRKMQLLRRT